MKRKKIRMTLWLSKDLDSLIKRESFVTKRHRTAIIEEALYKYFHNKNTDVQ